MKHFRLIFLLLTVTLFLAACERPLRGDEEAVATPPSTAPLEDKPADDLTTPPTEGEPAEGTEGDTTTTDTDTAAPAEGEGDTTDETVVDGETTTDETTTVDETPAAGEDIIYVVQSGDTLFTIALLYGVDVQDIIVVNGITNPDDLDVGQQLIVPLSGNITPPNGDGQTTDGEGGSEIIHVVSSGETLFLIAQAYGVDLQELIDYNQLANPDRLEVGQQIRIPQ